MHLKKQFQIEKLQTDSSILSMCLDYIGFVYRNISYYVLVSKIIERETTGELKEI